MGGVETVLIVWVLVLVIQTRRSQARLAEELLAGGLVQPGYVVVARWGARRPHPLLLDAILRLVVIVECLGLLLFLPKRLFLLLSDEGKILLLFELGRHGAQRKGRLALLRVLARHVQGVSLWQRLMRVEHSAIFDDIIDHSCDFCFI